MDETAVPERIEVAGGTEVIITWDDGEPTSFTAAQLRGACQCAECREEAGRRQTERILAGPEEVTIIDAKLVGG